MQIGGVDGTHDSYKVVCKWSIWNCGVKEYQKKRKKFWAVGIWEMGWLYGHFLNDVFDILFYTFQNIMLNLLRNCETPLDPKHTVRNSFEN